MKPILTRLFTGVLLLLAVQAFGQTLITSFVVIQPAAPPYDPGQHFIIEMRVSNFTNIEGMQFPIGYNKNVMRFDSIEAASVTLPNWTTGNYFSLPAQGKVTVSWQANLDPFGPTPNGVTVPNSTALFRLHFTSLANGASPVNLLPNSSPSIEVVRNNQGPITVDYVNGGLNLTVGTLPPPPPLVGFKIVANTIYIPQGQRGCMPVTVNDFDNIQSMQYVMHWDNTVLNYECVRNFNLPGWSPSNFNASPPAVPPGNLIVTWDDPAGSGVTRADGARIYDVCFKAVGAPGAQTIITMDGQNAPPTFGGAEAINTVPTNVWELSGPNGPSGHADTMFIITTPPVSSATTYTVDKDTIAPMVQTCVDIKVKNFNTVTNSEFVIAYNPQKLTYVSTQFGANPLNLAPANITIGAVPMPTPSVHYIKFLWSNANGVTVPNDASIFSVCFNATGANGDTSNVRLVSSPCAGMGTAKKTIGGVPMATNSGWVKIQASGPDLAFTPPSCNGGNNGSIQLTNPPSSVPTNYNWVGPNGFTSNVEDPTGLIAGTYTVTVTYSGGTTGTGSVTVTQPAALAQTNMATNVSCFGGSNGAIDLSPTGGTAPYTYMWSNGATTQDVNNLTVNIYTVTIKDANNCTLGPVNVTVSGFTQIALASSAVTNVTCAGLSTGGIEITCSGGAGGYTYDWSHNGAQTPDTDPKDLTNMQAGTYTVTVTDQNGCSMILPANGQGISITAPQPLVSNLVTKTNVKCHGTATGTAAITVTGGTGSQTFCWFTPPNGACVSTMPNPTNLPAGIFDLIVTDQNGCTSTHVKNVMIDPPPGGQITAPGTTAPSVCFDQPSGSINTSAAGGWGGFTYAWAGPITPQPVADPVGLPAGTYTVTVTDSGQCSATQTYTVGGSAAITENKEVQNVTCFGQNNGGIHLHLAGGNQPWSSIVWSNTPLTGESISNLAPGSYQPTVSDAQGCTKVFAPIVVTGPQELLIDTAIVEANPSNGSIDLMVLSGGTPMFSYLWSNGATTQDISNLASGLYTVTVTDANMCVRTFNFEVPNGNVLIDAFVSAIKNSCDHDGCITLEIPQTAAGQTPFTLNWGTGSVQTNSFTPTFCDLAAGVYNVTVTANNGNSVVLSAITVAQSDPASVNSNTQPPLSSVVKNGKITLDEAPGVMCNLLYQWGPAPLNSTSNEVINLGQGTYFVTITNPCSGCVSIESYTLEYADLFGSNETGSPTCGNAATGFINITIQGGNLPYTYQWTGPNGYQSNMEDISGLFPGSYTLHATDQDGRAFDSTYVLTAQSNLNITNVNELSQYGPFQVSGAAMCDGVAAVVFTPGVGTANIMWSNGVTGASNTTLCGGAYSVTVTDALNCSSVWSDALTAPDAIKENQQSAGVKCFGDCDGTARVYPTGGVPPYSVKWSTGQNDPLVQANAFSQAVNLCGGDYSITITDDNDIQQVFTVLVPQPAEIEAFFSPTTPRNFNSCDGELLLELEGAVEPVTYVWSGSFGHSGDSERAEELCSGEFVEFYITDANGCTAYVSDSVPYPEDGCFRVSPIITPGQQDGKNDFVVITCIETALDNHIEIYNRWGQLVFETDDYTNNDADLEHNWNGLTNTGAALAEGVYYYVLTFTFMDDQGVLHDDVRKGAINLLR